LAVFVSSNQAKSPTLVRRIGLPLMTFYGIGTILGAGIYALIGKVAGSAGLLAPAAFLVAAIVAGVTALSYCQLVILFPKSAGEAYYAEQGFKSPWLSRVIGYLVILTGIVSAATLANGFFGYLLSFVQVPRLVGIPLVILIAGLIALWGIAESLWLAGAITLIEIAGLLIVILLGSDALTQLPAQWPSLLLPVDAMELTMLLSGAFVAFYAFIGFEDMVNVVEEVKEPSYTMPRAIILALVISTLLYLLVAFVAVLGLPLDELAASGAPLKDLLAVKYPNAGQGIALISLFAIINGLLTQVIMASRVLYGMANQGRAPIVFASISALTHTPWMATIAVIALLVFFALWLPLLILAKLTSFVILLIFTVINLALWRLSARGEVQLPLRLPCWPRFGAVLCLGLLAVQLFSIIG